MSLPCFLEITKIDLKKSAKMLFQPLKWPLFPGPSSRSFEVKFAEMVPLTPINVNKKFHWNNQNILGKKCKNAISDPKNGRYFLRSSIELKFSDKVPLTPSNVPTNSWWNNQK